MTKEEAREKAIWDETGRLGRFMSYAERSSFENGFDAGFDAGCKSSDTSAGLHHSYKLCDKCVRDMGHGNYCVKCCIKMQETK